MFVSVIGYKQYLSKTFNNFNNMSKSEVFMFPDSYNNGGNNGSNIVARNVTGKYVYENRKVFEFEVRL